MSRELGAGGTGKGRGDASGVGCVDQRARRCGECSRAGTGVVPAGRKKSREMGKLMDGAEGMALGGAYRVEDRKQLEALNLAEGASRWRVPGEGLWGGGIGLAGGGRSVAVGGWARRGR